MLNKNEIISLFEQSRHDFESAQLEASLQVKGKAEVIFNACVEYFKNNTSREISDAILAPIYYRVASIGVCPLKEDEDNEL